MMSDLLFSVWYFQSSIFFFRCYTFWDDLVIILYFLPLDVFFQDDFLRFTLKPSQLMFHLSFHVNFFLCVFWPHFLCMVLLPLMQILLSSLVEY